MTWELLAIISIGAASVAALFERILMKEESSDPISYAIVYQFMLAIVAGVGALLFGKFRLPNDGGMWFRYIVSTILWAGAILASLKAMKLLPVGEAIILGTTSAIFSIFFGVLFLNERLTLPLVVGIGLIFLAIWIVFSEKLSFKSKSGMIFALLSALGGGAAIVNDMIILKTYEAFSYTILMSLLPGIIILIIFPKKFINNLNLFNRKTVQTMFLLAVFYSIQGIAYYVAIEQKAPISKLSPLTKSSVILTVILAAIFLKERSQMSKKVLAAVVVTIGAILVG